MENLSFHFSDGDFQSAESGTESPTSFTLDDPLPSSSVPLIQEDRRMLTVIASSSSCPESRGSRLGIKPEDGPIMLDDDDDSDCDEFEINKNDMSTESRKVIEPDISSIDKLLNFDSGDESCDDILDEVGDVTDKLLMEEDTTILLAIDDSEVMYQANKEQLHSSLKEELTSSWSQVSSSLAMANLSLEEVGHIRSVHAKADIEALPDEGSTKKNVMLGRICFQCVKTKFGLFCRSRKCPLCNQAVCSKCVAKISATPSSILLPVGDTSKVVDSSTLPRHRSATATSPGLSGFLSRTGSLRRHSGSLSSNQGSLITVCLDCRDMVVRIIRSGETARKMARSMMLASLVARDAERNCGQV